jgi:hypothetical protein
VPKVLKEHQQEPKEPKELKGEEVQQEHKVVLQEPKEI